MENSRGDPIIEPLFQDELSSQTIGVIVAVFAVILTIVLFVLWNQRKSKGQTVLLTGLCDSGKTLIYARLMQSKHVQTQTSISDNTGEVHLKNQTLKIVDIPGHERLRYNYFDKYKNYLKALIFVVDSATIQRDVKDATEYLYNLLSEMTNNGHVVPVLVLCNKQDQPLAKGMEVIRVLLEQEMNVLKITKSSQLEGTNALPKKNLFYGGSKQFEFRHLPIRVDFAECSAFNKDQDTQADLEELNKWLQKLK